MRNDSTRETSLSADRAASRASRERARKLRRLMRRAGLVARGKAELGRAA